MIRSANPADADAIARIYNHYILHTVISFEEEPVSGADMQRRMAEVQQNFPWLVYEEDGAIAGYAYATPWKNRGAYRNAAETTIYVDKAQLGKRIGARLYEPLLKTLRDRDLHVVMAGIALPNDGSVAIHERFGFVKVGHYREIGRKFDRWVDVGYWQLML
jgi:L-amino acid N-acyltransferase YncA